MKRFLIYYKTPFGKAEYWVCATNQSVARTLFKNEFISGNLDYETDGTIVSMEETE